MSSYLIEYRYCGYPKQYLQELYQDIKRRFPYISHPRYRYVPHFTIVAPTKTIFEGLLINKIKKLLFPKSQEFHEKGNLIEFVKYIKWKSPENRYVIAIEIKVPSVIKDIRCELEQSINKGFFSKCVTYKNEIWHTTLILTKSDSVRERKMIEEIWRYLQKRPSKPLKFIFDRLSIIKNKRILKEIDIANNEILSRDDALNWKKRYQSYNKLKNELLSKGEHFSYI